MLKNYLKTSWRNLLKNPLSSFINVFGLAMAIGVCIVVYAYLAFDFKMDQQHEKKDRVYMITQKVNRDGEVDLFGMSPTAIGLHLKADFPQVRAMTRIEDENVIAKHGDNVFRERIRLTDPDFMNMFTYPIAKGDQLSLNDPSKLIISHDIAIKYFGQDTDPIGQVINMRFPNGYKANFTVGAVAEKFPVLSSLRFDFLLNFENLRTARPDFNPSDWTNTINATFIELEDPKEIEVISSSQDNYLDFVNTAQPDYPTESFGFELLGSLYERSNYIRGDISDESDPEGRVVLSIIGIFLIALACLNYLNIAISSATKRLKEIGVRKVIGASRAYLVTQFIMENILLSIIALVMGFVLAATLFVPGFNNLFGLDLGFNIWALDLYLFLGGLLLITSIASGAYPAVYISKFQAVTIFRGKVLFGRKNLLTKIFLSLQFILACITVVTGIMATRNSNYQKNRSWGYDQANTMITPVEGYQGYEKLRNALAAHPDIESISGSSEHLGVNMERAVINLPDRTLEVYRMDIDETYVETMGLEIIAGRNFRKDFASDKSGILINEQMAEKLGWVEPLGKTFRFDSVNYEVIGMLKDYHYYSFWADIEPTFSRIADESNYRYLAIKAKEDKSLNVFESLESEWVTLFPEEPFEGSLQDQLYFWYFNNISGHVVVMNFVAILALLLSCFGLYGLVSLNVASRVKEFSVRKVLGAKLIHITNAINSHFLVYLLISLALGGPLSYQLVKVLFESVYKYFVPITVPPVLFGIALILGTVLLTVSSQVIKVLRANPTVGLRNE